MTCPPVGYGTMSSSFTPAERRLARILLAATIAGTLWHTTEALRPPPPPITVLRGVLTPDSTGVASLHDPRSGRVYSEGDTIEEPTEQRPLDLLTADERQLQMLPGIGPVLARRIVDWRAQRRDPWGPDDLLDVPGIGPATLARFRPLVTVGEWR